MRAPQPLPGGSIYIWMYKQGLRGVALEDCLDLCHASGQEVRDKDIQNWWNGHQRRDVYRTDMFNLGSLSGNRHLREGILAWEQYPEHPYGPDVPEIQHRWVPCNEANKPMIKWGEGCWSKVDAKTAIGSHWLAENLKGTRMIVIDFDGDHGEKVDWETVCFGLQLHELTGTHMLSRPGEITPVSFHLTFRVDRVIPTMHFPAAHIDVVGNKENSLRYWKNKKCTGQPMRLMRPEWWEMLRDYLRKRGCVA